MASIGTCSGREHLLHGATLPLGAFHAVISAGTNTRVHVGNLIGAFHAVKVPVLQSVRVHVMYYSTLESREPDTRSLLRGLRSY